MRITPKTSGSNKARAKMRLAECQDQLKKKPSPGQRTRLVLSIKVYDRILETEAKRNPIPLKLQV
jgi:hypothetical protein